MQTEPRNPYKDVLFGVAIGDALGVPVEFKSRDAIWRTPVLDMMGYGTYNQPPGTFSDDSTMTFCLAEALTGDFTLDRVAQYFVDWVQRNYWTAHNEVFDIGIATRQAIDRLANGVQPELAGGMSVDSNGNGSLMRILPLLFYIAEMPAEARFRLTKQVSSITHAHIRSVIACFYYLEYARLLLKGNDRFTAYRTLQTALPPFFQSLSINPKEIAMLDRLLKGDIEQQPEADIFSSGYVIHTLEASIWCLLTTTSYREATLKAVNLGFDTDTTGAVTGGLAGLLYGFATIPPEWVAQLARRNDIDELADRMQARLG